MKTTQNKPSKAFGVFVGLYNKLNETEISVKKAWKDPLFQTLFMNAELTLLQHSVKNNPRYQHLSSTKFKSYSLLDIPKVDNQVYQFLLKNPDLSRAEISDFTGIRLQTVCGAINRLMHNQLVIVIGEKRDIETEREVQTLRAVGHE